MQPLKYTSLTLQEKNALKDMMQHPGFAVQKKLFDDACRQANEALIKLNPEDADYDRLAKTRHMTARLTNEVCATLIKSIIMHSESAKIENAIEQQNKENKEPESAAPQLVGTKFGSFSMKPRPAAKQD